MIHPRLFLVFLLYICPLGAATALTSALVETQGTFKDQVLRDPTIVDTRLFLRRYDLVLKLLKKERLAEAAKELAEMREDFTGRSTAYLDYLRARIHLKLGDDKNPGRGKVYEWQQTNVGLRPDERYVYFPDRRPATNNLLVEKKAMPYPLEAKADYDLCETILTRLEQSGNPLLREAALLTRGDLSVSRGDGSDADRVWETFRVRHPGSRLTSDVLLRRARLAASERRFVQAADHLRDLSRFSPGGAGIGFPEEQARLMLSMTNADEPMKAQVMELISKWEKESRLGDELAGVLDALSPALGAP